MNQSVPFAERWSIDMKIAIISDTPYQLFNAIRLTRGNKEFINTNIDLFIGCQFRDCDGISRRIKESGVFNTVFDYYPYKRVRLLRRMVETMFPKIGIKQLMKNSDNIPMSFQYDIILLSCITEMSLNIILYNSNADIYFYDDGSGSYSRRVKPTSIIPKSHQAIYKMFGRDLQQIRVCGLYLNNPNMYNSDDFKREDIHKIALEKNINNSLLEKIFDVSGAEIYKDNKLVYLTEPDIDNDFEICNKIFSLCGDILVRPHPRQKDCSKYNGCIDRNAGMWELLSSAFISEKHVLISCFSTAQLTPFMLFGIEPVLIFTYRLYLKRLEGELVKNIESMIEKLKENYSDAQKIIVVNSFEEIAYCVKRIINGGIDVK